MICWRTSLPNDFQRTARSPRFPGFFVGRWESHGRAGASTSSEQRGAPGAANKTLKSIKTFLRWCVGRAILDRSPAEGVPLPAKEVARDRVLNDEELAQVILAARKMGGPYEGIVEMLALT